MDVGLALFYEDQGEDCGCLASTGGFDPHAVDEHSSCGRTYSGDACGGCHSCVSAQQAYYRQLEREHP